ncbi:MAG TPA: hypothetical protein VGW33_01065 [Terriglobia bacterium]|nr:hypothetical protein [Terriglobia bacterium]
MFENVRGDIRAIRESNQETGWWKQHLWAQNLKAMLTIGFSAVLVYRFGHWARKLRIPVVRELLMLVAAFLRRWTLMWCGIYIVPSAEIGPGLVIHSPSAVNIGKVKMGSNCTVASGVLIGCGLRSVGDNVYFGAGSKAVGDMKIGDNVIIMPNSLVLTDVADNTTIVGVPARIKLRGGRPQRFTPGMQAAAKPVAPKNPAGSRQDGGATAKPGNGNGAVAPPAPQSVGKAPLEAEVKKN